MTSCDYDEKARNVFRNAFKTSLNVSNNLQTKNIAADVENNANLIQTQQTASFDAQKDFSSDRKNYALRLLDLYPGQVKFSDLAEKMQPVVIDGMEHFTDILGIIEDENSPWMSCDVIYNNDEDTFGDFKRKSNNVGKPIEGAIAWAHYALFLEGNPHPLACSKLKGYPERIVIDEVLPGISIATYWLRPGQRGQFLLPAHTMFGSQGQPPSIPPNATILMLLHSLYWVDAGAIKRYESLDYELRSDFNNIRVMVENINEVGAVYSKQCRFGKASDIFSKLYEILHNCDPDKSSLSEINAFKMRVCVNMAICYIKIYKIDDAQNILEDAMDFGDWKSNCKYLYTRGRSYFENYEPEKALEFLIMALNLEPNNITVGREIVRVEKTISEDIEKEKERCQKMFKVKVETETKDCIFNFKNYTPEGVDAYLNAIKNSKAADSYPVPASLVIEESDMLENAVKKFDGLKFEEHPAINNISQNRISLNR